MLSLTYPDRLQVAVLQENLSDTVLELRVRNVNARRANRRGISKSCEHVCNWIHKTPYQDDLTTPGIFPWLASSRKQIRHNP